MARRPMLLEAYKSEIEKYCIENDLSIEKVLYGGCAQNYESAVLQYFTPIEELPSDTKLTIGGPPAPITLAIYLQDDGTLRFEQTDITRKHLGNEACVGEPALA